MGASRKIWISLAVVLIGAMLFAAPSTALAGSPLLSGYGGPGSGEQAILGSTLVGGSRGGSAGGSSGSGGSTGSGLSGAGGSSLSRSSGTSAGGLGRTQTGGAGAARGSGGGAGETGSASPGSTAQGAAGNGSRSSRGSRPTTPVGGVAAYIYPSTQASIPSASPLSGVSSGDVLLLIGIVATLALVATLTLRVSRLQR